MAGEVIKHDDLIEDGVFQPTIDQATQLDTIVKELIVDFKELAKTTGKRIPLADPKTLDEVDQLNKALTKLKTIEQEKTTVQKDAAIVQEKLRQANQRSKDEAKAAISAYAALNLEYKKAAQVAKDLAASQGINSKASKEAAAKAKELNDRLKEIDASMGNHQRDVGNYKKALEGLPGPLGNAASSVTNLGKQFMALLANPVILLLTAITGALYGLYKAFTSTDEGANKFNAIMEQISAVFDVIRQRASDVAKGIGNIFSGNFTEAAKNFSSAVSGASEQLYNAADAASKYVYELDRIEDAENAYISQAAENRNKIAKLQFLAADKSKSAQVRRDALKESLKIDEEESKRLVKIAAERFDNELNNEAARLGIKAETLKKIIAFDDKETELLTQNSKEANDILSKLGDERFKNLNKSYAAILDADTEFFERNKRNISKLSGFNDELAKEQQEAKAKRDEAQFEKSKQNIDALATHEVEVAKTLDQELIAVEKDFNKFMEEQEVKRLAAIEKRKLAEQEALKEQINSAVVATERINSIIVKSTEARIAREQELNQDRIGDIDRQIQQQQELAIRGEKNTLDYLNAERAKALEEKAKLEKRERKQEQAQQLANIFLEFFKTYASKDGGFAAASKATAQTVIAKGLSEAIAGSFADGVENFKGKGTGTSDSNLIAFSNGESVVTAKGTQANPGLVTAMNEGSVDDYIYKTYFNSAKSKKDQLADAMTRLLHHDIKELNKTIRDKTEWTISKNLLGELVLVKKDAGVSRETTYKNSPIVRRQQPFN